MRKNASVCLVFFLVVQLMIFIVLKRFHTFAESKMFFVSAEALLAVITALWYLMARPTAAPKPRPTPVEPAAPPQPEAKEEQRETEADESAVLLETVRRLEETELFAKQRLADLEQEKTTLKERLADAEGHLVEVQKTIDSCTHVIQNLTSEVERLMAQLEQERRQHSVEVRALLRKETEQTAAQTKKKQGKSSPAMHKVAPLPVPALLLLLSTCQKGLDLHVAHDWPDGEHRLLVRRKFFDTVHKMNSIPLAVVSLESPTEYFLSSKLPSTLSAAHVRAAVMEYKTSFSQLKRFEPYHVTDERLGGRWVAFRVAWENLDDLVALTPS